nr:hypothetical protein Iba_chr01cCG11840 [Ipomoea batatas]
MSDVKEEKGFRSHDRPPTRGTTKAWPIRSRHTDGPINGKQYEGGKIFK